MKPNFLWMMFRSGWGMKEGQETILAIWLKRSAFDTLLEQAVHLNTVQNRANRSPYQLLFFPPSCEIMRLLVRAYPLFATKSPQQYLRSTRQFQICWNNLLTW
jgi:Domain of unknown function (DUF4291)